MRRLFAIMLVMVLSACTKPEASIHFYDSHMYDRFVERLDEKKIEYRKTGKYTVFYPISENEKVKEIYYSVISETQTGCGGKFNDPVRQSAFELELKNRNIPYKIVVLDDGPWVVCPEQYRQESSIAFQAVLLGENPN
jgi:hypothetical protein